MLVSCFLAHLTLSQENINVVLVNSKNLEPIPFATIKILNTKSGTYSDENGKFSMQANAKDTVLISSIGFTTKKTLVGTSLIDTIFLDPYMQELDAVTIGQRKFLRNFVLGITRAKVDLSWGPSGLGEEFAQLINIPLEGNEIFKIKKVILHAKYFNPTTPVVLHVYSVNTDNGLPDKDLLQKIFNYK